MAKSYRGGIPFTRKYAPPEMAIEHIPERILISLKNGASCSLCEGDAVKKYSVLLSETEASPAVFAGVGGKVEHIYRIGSRADITLITDPRAEIESPFGAPEKDIADLTEGELSSLLLSRGISPVKKGKRDPRVLTVDCGGSPYNDSRLFIIRSFPEKVLLGAKIIMKLLGVRSCNFAIPASDTDAAQKLYEQIPSKSTMFGITLIKDKLPSTVPNLTVASLYSIEVNAAKDIFDSGYPIVSPLYCLACYRALVEGIPFCEGYLTVGEMDGEIDVFSVPFGASVKAIAKPTENEKVIRAESLFGSEITGETMTDKIEAITIINNAPYEKKTVQECIGCRRCEDICPARISPIDILNSLKGEKKASTLVLNAASCFECRSCSYICPSQLPLAETVIKLRRESGFVSIEIDSEDPDFEDDEEAEHE